MTSRDFCYWLQGYFEIYGTHPSPPEPFIDGANTLKPEQVSIIKKHLAMVFKHEIDPSMGPKPHQDHLNHLHNTPNLPDGVLIRC